MKTKFRIKEDPGRTRPLASLPPPKRPELGQTGFEVDWCYELPLIDGSTDADMDNQKRHVVVCPTMEKAMELAKKVYPLDKFGAVLITPVEYKDPYGDGIWQTYTWECIGDPIEYSGD